MCLCGITASVCLILLSGWVQSDIALEGYLVSEKSVEKNNLLVLHFVYSFNYLRHDLMIFVAVCSYAVVSCLREYLSVYSCLCHQQLL